MHYKKIILRSSILYKYLCSSLYMKFTTQSKIDSNWSTTNRSKDIDPMSRYHVHVAESSGNCFFFPRFCYLHPFMYLSIHSSTILILNKKLIKSQTRALETLNNSSNSHSWNNDEDLFFFLGNVNNKVDFFQFAFWKSFQRHGISLFEWKTWRHFKHVPFALLRFCFGIR